MKLWKKYLQTVEWFRVHYWLSEDGLDMDVAEKLLIGIYKRSIILTYPFDASRLVRTYIGIYKYTYIHSLPTTMNLLTFNEKR